MAQSTLGAQVSGYAAGARSRDLPPEVAEVTKLHILDTIAAIVSGSAMEPARVAQHYAQSVGGSPLASVLGTSIRVPLVEGALANGMAAHADESDDSHEQSQTHPGCGVVPSALVCAEHQHSPGQQFLRAVALGYEMTIRFAEAIGRGMSFKHSSLSSFAYGALLGGGYAAGSVFAFDGNLFRILLNYLSQEASGLTTWRLDERHTLKSYVFAGMPASNAVKAALLVRSGFTGGGDVLDVSNRNMLHAICADPRPEVLVDGLGQIYRVLETDIKKYPVGYPIAAPLAALERLLAQHAIDPHRVQEIRVYYHEDWYKVIGDQSRMPDVNLRYCLAVTLLDGALTFAAAHDAERMESPDLVAVGSRVKMLGPDPGQDRFAATVELVVDGRVLRAYQDGNVLGRAGNPMTKAQVQAKASALMDPVIGPARSSRSIELIDGLERVPDIRALIAELCPPTPE